nr:uncharacterized protein LOC129462110 [Symphalangus syndactylus]
MRPISQSSLHQPPPQSPQPPLRRHLFYYFFLIVEVSLCHPVWSAVAGSQLTANSAAWGQVILLPLPPEYLGLEGLVRVGAKTSPGQGINRMVSGGQDSRRVVQEEETAGGGPKKQRGIPASGLHRRCARRAENKKLRTTYRNSSGGCQLGKKCFFNGGAESTTEVAEPPNTVSVCMSDMKHDVLESWRKPGVKIKQGEIALKIIRFATTVAVKTSSLIGTGKGQIWELLKSHIPDNRLY